MSRQIYGGPLVWRLDTLTNRWVNLPGGQQVNNDHWGTMQYGIAGNAPHYWSMRVSPVTGMPYASIDGYVVRWTGTVTGNNGWENVGPGNSITASGSTARISCCPNFAGSRLGDMVIPADGEPLVVYITNSPSKVMVRRHTPTGWVYYGHDSNGISAAVGNQPRIALHPIDGTPYIAFRTTSPSNVFVVYRYEASTTSWSPLVSAGGAITVDTAQSMDSTTRLEFAPDGTPYLGWANANWVGPSTEYGMARLSRFA